MANTNFRDDGRKQFTTWEVVNLEMKNSHICQSRHLQYQGCKLQCTVMQYVHCLRNTHNRSTTICRRIIDVEYFGKYVNYHIRVYFSVIATREIQYGIGKEDCLPFHSGNLPFHFGIFHTEISIPHYAMPCWQHDAPNYSLHCTPPRDFFPYTAALPHSPSWRRGKML